ncbi:MAG TPA: ribose 5-phosphate isomerase A [Nitrososphaeraceae archaeon]|nr:ribose 5-phosphate isomerase A [Nitrososphaeraceae archaeon]
MNDDNNSEHLVPMLQNIIENYFLKLNEKKNFQKENIIIGLGSGSTVAELVKKISTVPNIENFNFIPTSIQIKLIAEKAGLKFTDETKINNIDLVIDGADQIDHHLNMIKGGGGALFKEKIIMYSANERVILADSKKFVPELTMPIPIEVHPFARSTVTKILESMTIFAKEGNTKDSQINNTRGDKGYNSGHLSAKPIIRTTLKGYPFITENGNIILDTEFSSILDVEKTEKEIKNIPGVIEVGLFSRKNNTQYYSVNREGKFSVKSS